MKKQGFTLMELILSIVLVSVIIITMIGTLLKIRESYSIINQNIQARTYKALVAKVINEHFIKNGGVKNITCVSDKKCEILLGNNKSMNLEIISNVLESKDITEGSNNVVRRLVETSTIKYYGNNYNYLKTIKMAKLIYNDGNEIIDGYKFEKILPPVIQKYENVNNTEEMLEEDKKYDTITNITIEMSDPKYNIELYSASIVDKDDLRFYTLTYDNNNGYGCIKTIKKAGENWGPLCQPTSNRSGYSFWGWFTQSTSGKEITDNTKADGNMTVYAQWTNKKFTCSAGTYLPKNETKCKTCEEDNYCPGVDNVLFDKTKDQGIVHCNEGYHSNSGSTNSSSCKINCSANTYIKNENDSTCTNCSRGHLISAHQVIQGNTSTCIAQKLTITYHKNDGSNATSTETLTYDGNMDDNNLSPTSSLGIKTGYTFNGWSLTASGEVVKTSFTSSVGDDWFISQVGNRATTSIDLYGNWTANTYTITLNRQGGTGGSTSIEATYDSSMPSISVPTKSGNTFEGYYSAANGGGTQYYNASGVGLRNWDSTTITELYAKWKANCRSTSHTYNASTGKCEYPATTKYRCFTSAPRTQLYSYQSVECSKNSDGTYNYGGYLVEGATYCPSQFTVCDAYHVGTWREGSCVPDGYSYGSCPGGTQPSGGNCLDYTDRDNCNGWTGSWSTNNTCSIGVYNSSSQKCEYDVTP